MSSTSSTFYVYLKNTAVKPVVILAVVTVVWNFQTVSSFNALNPNNLLDIWIFDNGKFGLICCPKIEYFFSWYPLILRGGNVRFYSIELWKCGLPSEQNNLYWHLVSLSILHNLYIGTCRWGKGVWCYPKVTGNTNIS